MTDVDPAEEPVDSFELLVESTDGEIWMSCPVPRCGWNWSASSNPVMLGVLATTAVRHVRGSHKEYPLEGFFGKSG